MAIDLSENGRGFEQLQEHLGHDIHIVTYGATFEPDERVVVKPVNVAIECVDCCTVLVDFDNPRA